MFTVRDICTVAAQIEQNGERFYRSTQAKVGSKVLKDMLGWLADEEKRHAQWFSDLSKGIATAPGNLQIEELGRTLLQDSMNNQTFSLDEKLLMQADGIERLCRHAIEFEQDTIVFYEMLRAFIDTEETLAQLDKIIGEEKQHVAKLTKLTEDYEDQQGKK
jgi:rubrerythrin